jgi:hypothetical protein
MTTEEKAKAYDEALERAKNFIENGDEGEKTVAESIFAGLVESEDERIRKTLSVLVQNAVYPGLITEEDSKKCLAYLERQKEQKSIECSREDEEIMKDIVAAVEMYGDFTQSRKREIYAYLKKQKPSFFSHDIILWDSGLDTGIEIGKKQKEQKNFRKLYEDIAQSEWFKKNYVGKSLGEEQKPINQCNTHEPTLDEARKWNEAYEKGYSLGYENGKNEQKPEWSEDDEKMSEGFMHKLEVCDLLTNKEIAWAKHRLNSLHPQPKQEWSEEDRHAIENCKYAIKKTFTDKEYPRRVETLDWLNSLPGRFNLQPKQERGEDEDKLDEIHSTTRRFLKTIK